MWIRYDLGSAQSVGSVSIAWHKGDTRRDAVDVQLSDDRASWTTVLARKSGSGTTLQPQDYDFPDRSARYVRIVGHGNTSNDWTGITSNDWTGITETVIHGADSGGTRAYPANVVDLTNWYVGLPVGEGGVPTDVAQPALATCSANPWFAATPDCAEVTGSRGVRACRPRGSRSPTRCRTRRPP